MTDREKIAAEIVDKVRVLTMAPGYTCGQIDELRLLVAEHDATPEATQP